MKHRYLLYALTLYTLVSCHQYITPSNHSTAQLLVSIQSSTESRATSAIPSTAQDENISTIILYIFDSQSQKLELMYEATQAEVAAGKMIISISAGKKDFYIIANYDATDISRLSRVEDYDDLKYQSSDLCKLTEGNFMMTGNSLNFDVVNDKNQRVDIALERAAVRIIIKDIVGKFDSNKYYNQIYIDSIYLLNATGLSSYSDKAIMFSSQKSYDRVPDVKFAFQNYDIFCDPIHIDCDDKFSDLYPNGTHYYTYQNTSSESPTYLVITGLYSAYQDRVYYVFALEKDGQLLHNYSYELDIELTGMGTPTIETELSGAECSLNINPWYKHHIYINY